ncbi:MAG: gliding motility lipoprotein GldH [Bacteroidales bacterium]|nr:gliding motility lipoprotein GldH [Bacteroidales bacterium]
MKIFFSSKPFFLISFLIVLFLSSCDLKSVYDKNFSFENTNWDKKNKVSFKIEISDTISQNQFFINIRNTTNYKYSNLYLFISTQLPDGSISKDTIECILADINGKWLGNGLSKLKENNILLKNDLVFPEKGTYIFEFEQAMRVDILEGIADIGIRIEENIQ